MTATESSLDDGRVRDHLANERTYLAWIRTGVSMMGLGIVIAKLKYILGPAYPQAAGAVHAANIGILFAVIGLTTIGIAVLFFIQTQKEIREGTYRSRKRFVVTLASLTIGLGIIILWYLMQPMA